MPKLKPGHIRPSAEEEAAINAGIAADAETAELDDAWFAAAKPARQRFAPETFAALLALKPSNRQHQKTPETQVVTTIPLDADLRSDLLASFKATGKDWPSRINAALRQFIAEHPLSR